MLNLKNVKGISIPVYSEKQIREMLSDKDLQEFLELIGYVKPSKYGNHLTDRKDN